MNLCTFCKIQIQIKKSICADCLDILKENDYHIQEQNYFEQNKIDDLYYSLIKIDDHFDKEDNKQEYHKKRVKCLSELLQMIIKNLEFEKKFKNDLFLYLNLVDKFHSKELIKSELIRLESLKKWFLENIKERKIAVLLKTLISSKEDLDWSWYQFMEICFIDLVKYLDKSIILKKLNKFFFEEMNQERKPNC